MSTYLIDDSVKMREMKRKRQPFDCNTVEQRGENHDTTNSTSNLYIYIFKSVECQVQELNSKRKATYLVVVVLFLSYCG